MCAIWAAGACKSPHAPAPNPSPRSSVRPPDGVLRVGIIVPQSGVAADAVVMGAELGEAEAQRTAALLGREIGLVTERVTSPNAAVKAAERLIRDTGVAALIGGMNAASCAALSDAAQRTGALFFNIGCREQALRAERCRATTLHIAASDSMVHDALATAIPADGAPGDIEVALWHPELERYGASQLNDRFRDRFGQPMDDDAWTGWVAVKILWEAALRTTSTDPAVLARYLTAEGTQFDGQKGKPLSFRTGSYQLRQPLYVLKPAAATGAAVAGAERVRELPGGRLAPGQSSREFLDQLGGDAPDLVCGRIAAAR